MNSRRDLHHAIVYTLSRIAGFTARQIIYEYTYTLSHTLAIVFLIFQNALSVIEFVELAPEQGGGDFRQLGICHLSHIYIYIYVYTC